MAKKLKLIDSCQFGNIFERNIQYPVGLIGAMNCCYFNSVIQSFMVIPNIQTKIKEFKNNQNIEEITKILYTILSIYNDARKLPTQKSAINISNQQTDILRLLNNNKLKLGYQCDPVDLLTILLDKIQNNIDQQNNIKLSYPPQLNMSDYVDNIDDAKQEFQKSIDWAKNQFHITREFNHFTRIVTKMTYNYTNSDDNHYHQYDFINNNDRVFIYPDLELNKQLEMKDIFDKQQDVADNSNCEACKRISKYQNKQDQQYNSVTTTEIRQFVTHPNTLCLQFTQEYKEQNIQKRILPDNIQIKNNSDFYKKEEQVNYVPLSILYYKGNGKSGHYVALVYSVDVTGWVECNDRQITSHADKTFEIAQQHIINQNFVPVWAFYAKEILPKIINN